MAIKKMMPPADKGERTMVKEYTDEVYGFAKGIISLFADEEGLLAQSPMKALNALAVASASMMYARMWLSDSPQENALLNSFKKEIRMNLDAFLREAPIKK